MKVPNSSCFQISVNVHNLMINPDDLPNDDEYVLNEKGEKVYHSAGEWYIYSDYYEEEQCLCATPKLWYDIPKFNLKLTKEDLEEMPKEELIQMILREQK